MFVYKQCRVLYYIVASSHEHNLIILFVHSLKHAQHHILSCSFFFMYSQIPKEYPKYLAR